MESHTKAILKFCSEVRVHMLRHFALQDAYACDQCQLSFINENDLEVHKKIAHVFYLKGPKLKSSKMMSLVKYQLPPELLLQQKKRYIEGGEGENEEGSSLTFFQSEEDLIACLGPNFCDPTIRQIGFNKRYSNKPGHGRSRVRSIKGIYMSLLT